MVMQLIDNLRFSFTATYASVKTELAIKQKITLKYHKLCEPGSSSFTESENKNKYCYMSDRKRQFLSKMKVIKQRS